MSAPVLVRYRRRPLRRTRRSRGRLLLSAAFALAALAVSCQTLSCLADRITAPGSFPVRALRIDGTLRYVTRREIADVVGVLAGGRNLATLDVGRVHNALLHLPWIAQVAVARQMPGTLIVAVAEHVPAAYWNDRGLFDAHMGTVFYPALEDFDRSLVRLRGSHDELAPEIYDYAVRFRAILSRAQLQMVQVELDAIRAFRIVLDSGVVLVLGRDDDHGSVLTRLQRFVDAYLKVRLNFDNIAYIDLRYDAGFAVGSRSGSQAGGERE